MFKIKKTATVSASIFLIVLIAAILFRLVFFAWGCGGWRCQPLNMLAKTYLYQGYALCAGYGYVRAYDDISQFRELEELASHRRITPSSAPPKNADFYFAETLHPPGLPLLVAAVHWVFGGRADVPVKIIQIAFDVAAAGIVTWIAAVCFGSGVGCAAGLLYAFNPVMAYETAVNVGPEGTLGFFVAASLACAVKTIVLDGSLRIPWLILGGVLIGLGGYFRPDYVLLPFAIAIGAWLCGIGAKRAIITLGVLQMTALVVLTPWAVRNRFVCERWIFTSTSVGGTLVTGLAFPQNPWGLGPSDGDRGREAAEHGYRSPWSVSADEYFRGEFRKMACEKPIGYLYAVLHRMPNAVKGPYFIGYVSPSSDLLSPVFADGPKMHEIFLKTPFIAIRDYVDRLIVGAAARISLVGFGGVAYMLIRQRRRFGVAFLAVCPHLYSIGTHLLTHLEPRFLVPSLFCLLIGLAYAIVDLSSMLCRLFAKSAA